MTTDDPDRIMAIAICRAKGALSLLACAQTSLDVIAYELGASPRALMIARLAYSSRDTWLPLNEEWNRAARDIAAGRPGTVIARSGGAS